MREERQEKLENEIITQKVVKMQSDRVYIVE